MFTTHWFSTNQHQPTARPAMPKQRRNNIKRKRPNNATRRRKRVRARTGTGQMAVHRRIVLFPKVNDSQWLQKLSWFASVALKLFALVTGVSDDLIASSANVGSGTVIVLGPGDFAAFSPVAIPIVTSKADKEVVCLKAFPYERASLRTVHIRIVPSVDIGERGGMYAACLIPIDPYDSTLVGNFQAKQILDRYSCNYDDIIKNPRARMAPVNKTLTLSLTVNQKPSNIRIHWDNADGFINTYPSCALLVAFSDLAAKQAAIDSNYAPNKSLFEVHMTGHVLFSEPGEITVKHDSSESSMSCYTPKLSTTNTGNINVRFFDHSFDSKDGTVDLRTIDAFAAKQMLSHFGRLDLLPKLSRERDTSMEFERLEV